MHLLTPDVQHLRLHIRTAFKVNVYECSTTQHVLESVYFVRHVLPVLGYGIGVTEVPVCFERLTIEKTKKNSIKSKEIFIRISNIL